MLILSISSAIIAISIIVFCVINNINTRNYNSIEYQIQKAQQALDNRDYEKALSYYNRALELDVDNVDIYFAIADMSKFMALIIDSLNHNVPISNVMLPTDKIHALLAKHSLKFK